MKKIILLIVLLALCHAVHSRGEEQQYQKGDLRFDFGLPHFNTLSFKLADSFRDVEYGFNGYSAGFEYSYRDKKFVALNAAFVTTFEWFITVPVDAEYNKIMFSSYLNVTDNIVLGSFTLGYGFHYSVNTWNEFTRNLDTTNRQPEYHRSHSNNNVGLTFNAYFRAGRTLHFGLIYQPSLLNLNNGVKAIYDHSISAGVLWRFKLLNTNMRRQRIRRI